MIKLSSKIRSVKVIELIVVLATTGILLGMVLFFYQKINLSFNSYQTENTKQFNLIFMVRLLKKDFDHADIIQSNDFGHFLTVSNCDTHHYKFHDNYLIIESKVRRDTFIFDSIDLEYSTLAGGDLIENISLNVGIDGMNEKLVYHKKYSSRTLIEKQFK